MVYPISRYIYFPFLSFFVRKINGIENLPSGPFIFCANHASFLDDLIVPYFIVKKTNRRFHIYVNSRFYKSRILKTFLDHYECLPVYVEKYNHSKQKNEQAFQKALKGLKKGKIVLIFPEGRRTIDGKLQKAKNGAARLALSAKVPVLPIGIIGSYELFPKGRKFPRIKRNITLNIGKPLSFKKFYGKENNKKALDNVSREIMKTIAELSRQEYPY